MWFIVNICILLTVVQQASAATVQRDNSSILYKKSNLGGIVLQKNDAMKFLKRSKRGRKSKLKEYFKEECCKEKCGGEEIWEMREESSKSALDNVLCEVSLKERDNCYCAQTGKYAHWAYPLGGRCAKGSNFPSSDACRNPCPDGMYHCGSGTGNVCYPSEVECDSFIDCPNKADERGCNIARKRNNEAQIRAATKLGIGAQQYCDLKVGSLDGEMQQQPDMPANDCIAHCINKAKVDRKFNGVSLPKSTSNTCYCHINAVNINIGVTDKLSCIFETNGPHCVFKTGDGIGGSETREYPDMSADQCVQRCIQKRESNPNINGATFGIGTKDRRCYCENRMTSWNTVAEYKSCKFESVAGVAYQHHAYKVECHDINNKHCTVPVYTKEECQMLCTRNYYDSSKCTSKRVCQFATFFRVFSAAFLPHSEMLHLCFLYADICLPRTQPYNPAAFFMSSEVWEKKLENMARGKPTSQSGNESPSSRANDGNRYQHNLQMCATGPAIENPTENQLPFWMVDLQKNVKIHHIRMYFRLDTNADIRDLSIWIKSATDEEWSKLKNYPQITQSATNRYTEYILPYARTARFVKVTLNAGHELTICEFEVYGRYQDQEYCDIAPGLGPRTAKAVGFSRGGSYQMCVVRCLEQKQKTKPSINGVTYTSSQDCYCSVDMTRVEYHSTYKACMIGSNQKIITTGNFNSGSYQSKKECPAGTKITGFRLRLGSPRDSDLKGITQIQLACTDGSQTSEGATQDGVWTDWKYCDKQRLDATSNYVVGFNYKSLANQGSGDDQAGTDINMLCNNKEPLLGGGATPGEWHSQESYMQCDDIMYPCGIQEQTSSTSDKTGVNKLNFICCSNPLQSSITLGKTNLGIYKVQQLCKPGAAVTGFNLRVDRRTGVPKTGINGLELACTDGSTTMAETGLYGEWTGWKYCDSAKIENTNNYVTSFTYKSQAVAQGNMAGTDMDMKCSNGEFLRGGGDPEGTWDRKAADWAKCVSKSYLCGVQVQIGSNGVNHVRFICCTDIPLSADPYAISSTDGTVYSGNVYVLGRPICEDGWDDNDAKVLCKTLAFTEVVAKSWKYSKFGIVNKDFIMTDVRCGGYETYIGACSQNTAVDQCVGTQAAGVTCVDPTTTMLVGGMEPTEGNVYIISQPVCDTEWDLREAKVVCNQLFGTLFTLIPEGVPVFGSYTNSQYGSLPGSDDSIKISCTGSENTLAACTLEVNKPCAASRRAGAKCAKCTPAMLLEIVEIFQLGVLLEDTYNSIGTAIEALGSRCLKWDCTDFERSYKELCTIDAFLIDAQLIMESTKDADRIIYLETTVDYGAQVSYMYMKQSFANLKDEVFMLGDRVGDFQQKLAEHFTNIAKFEEEKNKEDMRMITNKWHGAREDIAARQEEISGQLRTLLIASFFAGASEIAEYAVELAAILYDIDFTKKLTAPGKMIVDIQKVMKKTAQASGRIAKAAYAAISSMDNMKEIIDLVVARRVIYDKKYGQIQNLIQNGGELTLEDSRKFLKFYKDFAPPVWPMDIANYAAQLTELVASTCGWLGGVDSATGATMAVGFAAAGTCPKIKANINVVVASYSVSFEIVKAIKGKLSTIAQAKIAQAGANKLSQVLGNTLSREIEKQITRRNVLLLLQLEKFKFIREACNYITYFSHGIERDYCTRLLTNPNLDIGRLISFRYSDNMCECNDCITRTGIFHIPAVVPDADAPSPLPDGTIDLSLIYKKLPTSPGIDGWFDFKIPDKQWLTDNGWINSRMRTNGPFFLQQFELYYPPAPEITHREYEVYSDFKLTNNVLNEKAYPLATTVKLRTIYAENRPYCYSGTTFVHPYNSCAKHGSLCVSSSGEINGNIYPSLVASTWRIRVSSPAPLVKPETATTFYIKARVKFCYRPSGNGRRSLVAKREPAIEGCCKAPNTFFDQMANLHFDPNGPCKPCPANSAPRLGGYFCEKCPSGNEQSTVSRNDVNGYGCVPCGVDKYKETAGVSTCLPCAAGKTTGTNTGSDKCVTVTAK